MNDRKPPRRPALEPLEGRITPTPIVDPPFANFGQEASFIKQFLQRLPDRGESILEASGFANYGGAVSHRRAGASRDDEMPRSASAIPRGFTWARPSQWMDSAV